MSPLTRRFAALAPLAVLFALLLGLSAGCTTTDPFKPPPPQIIKPRLLPADVVKNLKTVYRTRDINEYALLLGSEFQFWFDPATRKDHAELPEYWSRREDSTGTGNLFASEQISNVKIELTYGPDVLDNRIGHERWRKITITDTNLSVDKAADDGVSEATTYVVDGDLQEFYVRRGFTEGDTLPGSPTAQEWFLVEWRDKGKLQAPVDIARK